MVFLNYLCYKPKRKRYEKDSVAKQDIELASTIQNFKTQTIDIQKRQLPK